MKRPPLTTSISRSITRRCSLLPQKISTLNQVKNASPIPTLPRHKTLPRTTIPRKTIPPAAAMIAQARILAGARTAAAIAAETVVGIAAGVAVGDGVVDASVADARRVARAGATCLLQNMHPRKAASPADMTIAADRREVMTIGGRNLRAARRLPCQSPPRMKLFFLVNRWQNIATSQPLRKRRFPALSMKPAKSRKLPKKLPRAQPAICLRRLPAVAAFLAGSPAVCPAGFWPMLALKQKRPPRQKLPAVTSNLTPQAAQPSNPRRRPLLTVRSPPGMTLN